MDARAPVRPDLTVLVVGAGNIGSHLQHIARTPRVGRVIVVDRDRYEASNLLAQSISPADVGRWKAHVMARNLRRINPMLEVEPVAAALEDIPLGRLRADVWLTCLDSKAARQVANEYAFRLGVPVWIDAGVETSGRLARVSIFTPAAGKGCIECQWSADDYRIVSQSFACDGSGPADVRTDGVSSLGALAASLQALECQMAIDSDLRPERAGHEILVDASSYRSSVSRLCPSPSCRFDHRILQLDRLPPGCRSLGDLTALAEDRGCAPRLWVEGRAFVGDIRCRGCGRGAALSSLSMRSPRAQVRCRCGTSTDSGFESIHETLDLAALPASRRRSSLRAAGLRPGEVVSLGDGANVLHFEIDHGARRA